MTAETAVERAWRILDTVPDPEIPVLSIRELGILREIRDRGGPLEVVLTPTYSGCPAIHQIEEDVRVALAAHDLPATVVTRLAPAWTTDWIGDEAREKLRAWGIAPPHTSAADHIVRLARQPLRGDDVPCPRCDSHDTTETSPFGSTACKALYRCLACREPFDHFKPY